ncbi:MAG: quinoprotein glucose dehydrogenase [Halieaceae bacterium]
MTLDVTTGKPVWSYQAVHRDAWDYDLGSQATLVDFPTPTGSAGFRATIRAIDLRSGKTLWDRPFGTARAYWL